MMHCQSGVTKGISKGGNPIEVMGMLLGRPDPDTPKTLIIVDAFPLPIEGFETRVVADDANVVNHMIALGECLEDTRHEKFMGWYHSHPFDVGPNSHCFLSQTDLSTQLQWQRAEDPHGNPFVALVVDPLRSLHKAVPEIKAFRAYPPEYNSPVEYECPDGSTEVEETKRLELWGSCWNRYYTLEVEYFMSSSARRVLEQLTQDYLWMRTLSMDQQELDEQSTAEALKKASAPLMPAAARVGGIDLRRGGGATTTTSTITSAETKDVSQAVDQVVGLASQQLYATTLTNVKKQVFSSASTPKSSDK
jgi:COP9 signalosome complex subunit 5